MHVATAPPSPAVAALPTPTGIQTVDGSDYVDPAESAKRGEQVAVWTEIIRGLTAFDGRADAATTSEIYALLRPLMASADEVYGELALYQEMEPVYATVEDLYAAVATDEPSPALRVAVQKMSRAEAEAALTKHGLAVGLYLVRAKGPSAVLSMCVATDQPVFAHHILQVWRPSTVPRGTSLSSSNRTS